MFINNYSSTFARLLKLLVDNLSGLYKALLFFIIFLFLTLRMPYIYGVNGFMLCVAIFIAPLFFCICLNRLSVGLNPFFSSLIPPGTPMGIAPFVGLAETISYLVRPFVLMLRPFLNITIGALGGASLGLMCTEYSFIYPVLILVFFYEIFVGLVHWYIVNNILSFSINH